MSVCVSIITCNWLYTMIIGNNNDCQHMVYQFMQIALE